MAEGVVRDRTETSRSPGTNDQLEDPPPPLLLLLLIKHLHLRLCMRLLTHSLTPEGIVRLHVGLGKPPRSPLSPKSAPMFAGFTQQEETKVLIIYLYMCFWFMFELNACVCYLKVSVCCHVPFFSTPTSIHIHNPTGRKER